MASEAYLLRSDSPLEAAEWARIDAAVTEYAARALVGRRFISIFGPLGAGQQVIPDDVFASVGRGSIGRSGDELDLVRTQERRWIELPMVYKDFTIGWRDLESIRRAGTLLDVSPAAAAAIACARAEDELVFNGYPPFGQSGLLNAPGHLRIDGRDWAVDGEGFRDIVDATQRLVSEGFIGPYAVVVSPRLYVHLNRVYRETGILELEQVQQLATDGVYRSPLMPESTALVVATGPQNMDLVVGQTW